MRRSGANGERRVNVVREAVAKVPGARGEMFVPEIHYRSPHVRVRWNPDEIRLSVADLIRQLREGDPAIEVRPNTNEGLELSVWLLAQGEVEIVARRVSEVLRKGR